MSRDAEKRAKRARDRYENALRYVLGDPRGRHFVACLIDKTGMYGSLRGNNAGEQSMLIGRRDLGLELLYEIRDSFDLNTQFRLMEDEARALRLREATPPNPPPDEGEDE